MVMNLLVIVFVLGIAYTWTVRGVFNSMIHAMCVFFAGAIAFAVWEPLAVMMLGLSDSALVEGMAWGVSLIVPFLVMTVVLRISTDKIVKANIKSAKVLDYGGAAFFGLVSSVITAGVLVIGIGYMRLPSTFLGYQPVWYTAERTGAGSLVENDKLWIPVDSITAMVYKNLSSGFMSSKESLKKWYPDLTLTGFAARITPGDGAARNAITKDAFEVLSSYTIGKPEGKMPLDLSKHNFVTLDGKSFSQEHAGFVAGYVVEFGPKAKEKGEKGGQVVISNGQIRLLTKHNDGSTHTIFPIATISESSTQGRFGRWAFDGNDVFITSTGGKSRVQMGFEFFVPADETPMALYVKNIRVPVNSMGDPAEFATASERDKLVPTGSLLSGDRPGRSFDLSKAVTIDPSDRSSGRVALFSDSIGTVMSIQLAKPRGLRVNGDNLITSGKAKFDLAEEVGRKNAPKGKKLRVGKFWYGEGLEMVQVKIGSTSAGGLLSEAAKIASGDDPFILVDIMGDEYEAVGYIFEDKVSNLFKIRYTPGSTLNGQNESEFPQISRSKEGQNLSLIFLVSKKIEIQYFTIGDVVLMKFEPGLSRR